MGLWPPARLGEGRLPASLSGRRIAGLPAVSPRFECHRDGLEQSACSASGGRLDADRSGKDQGQTAGISALDPYAATTRRFHAVAGGRASPTPPPYTRS